MEEGKEALHPAIGRPESFSCRTLECETCIELHDQIEYVLLCFVLLEQLR